MLSFVGLMIWMKGNKDKSSQSNEVSAKVEWKIMDIDKPLINEVFPKNLKRKSQGDQQPISENKLEEVGLEKASSLNKGDKTPKIALLVHGLGFIPEVSEKAIKQLSSAITISFVPYAENVQKYIQEARSKGHEVLMSIPMETVNYPQDDPGPQTLLTGLDPQENIKRLHWTIDRANGCVGVCNYFGSRFTAVREDLKPVLEEIQRQGLIFMDTKSALHTQVSNISKEIQLKHAVADLTVKIMDSYETFMEKLDKLIVIAKSKGYAVGVIQVTPHRLDQLIEWEKTLDDVKFELVPLSEIVMISEPRIGETFKEVNPVQVRHKKVSTAMDDSAELPIAVDETLEAETIVSELDANDTATAESAENG